MARDTSGPKNEPQYSASSASSQAADLTEVGAFAAFNGNRKVGPTTGAATGPGGSNTGRTTSSGADVWDGLQWWDTTLKAPFVYQSGAWVRGNPSYREFTFNRTTVTDDSLFFLTLTEVTANASNPAFSYSYVSTGADNGKLTLEAGNYSGVATVFMGTTPTTGTSFAQVRDTSTSVEVLGRQPVAYPADPYASVPFMFRANGTDQIIFEGFKHNGSTTTMTGRLRLWKIGEL